MIYRFRRDKKLLLISVLTVVLVPAILCVAWLVEGEVEAFIALPFWLLLMAGIMLRTPRCFYIEKELIVIEYYVGRKVLTDIRSVRRIDRQELKGTVRLFGNGGLFAYAEWCRSRHMGKFCMIAVNKDELALVTLAGGKKYVINYPGELLEKKRPPQS